MGEAMITLAQINALRAELVSVGRDPAVLDDEVHNATECHDSDGHGTLSYADTRGELGLDGVCATTNYDLIRRTAEGDVAAREDLRRRVAEAGNDPWWV